MTAINARHYARVIEYLKNNGAATYGNLERHLDLLRGGCEGCQWFREILNEMLADQMIARVGVNEDGSQYLFGIA